MLITAASIVGIYALVKYPGVGLDRRANPRLPRRGLRPLLAGFVALESRIETRSCRCGCSAYAAWLRPTSCAGFLVTGAYSTFFLGSLYFEHVRGMSPIEIGLAFLAMSLALATMSAGLAARLVARFGPKPTLIGGIPRTRPRPAALLADRAVDPLLPH